MEYGCEIVGKELRCFICADRDLAAPVFQCSAMAPITATVGGRKIAGVGSFTQIALPDLKAGQPHVFTLVYEGGYTPANRAWKPIGPTLRAGGNAFTLDPGTLGRGPVPLPDLGPFDGLPLVPQPQAWRAGEGTLDAAGFVFDDPALQAASALGLRCGMGDLQGEGTLRLEQADLPPDSYEIVITEMDVTVRSGSYGGRFYAGVTLLTLMQHGPLPCGTLHDAPRFGWRGQHLDCARHFFSVDTICELLDLMALLKLNRFHWHFADDEAFRLEVDCLPALWRQSRIGGADQVMPPIFAAHDGAGGSYGKRDVARILDHARTLNIEIMPEIEVPAHALALTRIFPETRDPGDNGAETSVQGYKGNAVNPAMPRTWEVLEALVAEIGAMFPLGYLHLGCDELPEGTWMGSPRARALMKSEELETTADLQGWMMARLAARVRSNGQRPAAWEEAAKGSHGGIGNDALLFSWTGQGPGLDAARAGYDVVMTPAQHVYLDMAHSDDPGDWGASWAAFIALADTVAWDPVPDAKLAKRIKGVQGCFWSEFTTQDAQLWPMLVPRILGVAAMAWQQAPPTGDDLIRLANGHPVVKAFGGAA